MLHLVIFTLSELRARGRGFDSLWFHVVYMNVPLSPRSVIWYLKKGSSVWITLAMHHRRLDMLRGL